MTNYISAHDTNKSMTVDKFLNEEGEETIELSSGAASALSMAAEELPRDSIWNFHVWNEVIHTRLYFISCIHETNTNSPPCQRAGSEVLVLTFAFITFARKNPIKCEKDSRGAEGTSFLAERPIFSPKRSLKNAA